MPATLPWQPNATSDIVLRHLLAGDCVALPTESTYEIVASALSLDAVRRLEQFASSSIAAIVISDYQRLHEWLPLLCGAGSRLVRKLGPGPITLQAEAGFIHGLWSRLPESARKLTIRDASIAVRRPAHPIWTELGATDLPLISVPLEATHAPGCGTLLPGGGDYVACIVDAGPTPFGQLPSIAKAEGRRCLLLKEGGLTRDQFDDLTTCHILFVCTGNTCRSPMAAGLCAKLLADQLGCLPSDLKQHGFSVQSAGLAAMMGAPASPDAVVVAAEFGTDISAHSSRMITLETLLSADHIFAMTAGHWYTMKSIPVAAMMEPRLLSPQDEDVSDPIGGERSDYRACANQLLDCLRQRLPELLENA
jgi:L-threonylcarbamoyladenylate synthase